MSEQNISRTMKKSAEQPAWAKSIGQQIIGAHISAANLAQ